MKNLMEVVFIIDRSGSMSGQEYDIIGGFNAVIAKQKKEDYRALVSTVLFNGRTALIHDRAALDSVPDMTEQDYCVYGNTALLDAVLYASDTNRGECQPAVWRRTDTRDDPGTGKQRRVGVHVHRRRY